MSGSQRVLGRERELSESAGFLDSIERGAAALVLEGEPGIGKTTLWRTTVSDAGDRSYHVLSARPGEREARLSFAALADLLTGVGNDVLAALPEIQRRGLDAALLRGDPGRAPPNRRTVSTAAPSATRTASATTRRASRTTAT